MSEPTERAEQPKRRNHRLPADWRIKYPEFAATHEIMAVLDPLPVESRRRVIASVKIMLGMVSDDVIEKVLAQ